MIFPERVCRYAVVYHSPNRPGVVHGYVDVRDGFEYRNQLDFHMANLSFNTRYDVQVNAVNERDRAKEGPMFNYGFFTPPTLAFNLTEDTDGPCKRVSLVRFQ